MFTEAVQRERLARAQRLGCVARHLAELAERDTFLNAEKCSASDWSYVQVGWCSRTQDDRLLRAKTQL
jgi:hypothetical protein